MDNKLLNALNNIGDGLDALVEALADKANAKSDTGAALQTGDFGKQLESISQDIKSIKTDTQQIIKNQQTILGTAKQKEKESKLGVMDSLGGDESMMKNILTGIGVIMLLAVAVLAIGMAFKLVGKVDILSVIGLAIGITIISIAFEKVAQMKLGLKEAAIASAVMVIMSVGLMLSSYILNLVQPVAPMKMLTAIFIAGGFALLAPSIGKLIKAFKGMGIMSLIKTVIFLPLILPAISLGIALSSNFLQNIKPIGVQQAITAILITGIFVVLSFGLRKMLGSFKGINPVSLIMASLFIPVVLVSISLAIAASSEVLSTVKTISMGAFFGAILISIIFVVLSYSVKNMVKAFKGIDPVTAVIAAFFLPTILVSISQAIADSSDILSKVKMMSLGAFFGAVLVSLIFVVISFGIKRMISAFRGIDPATAVIASLTIPILMVAISGAIWLSSIILDKMTIVSSDKLINAGLIGAGLAVLSIALVPSIKILSKIGIGDIIKGALILPIIALTIMVSSHILALGNYDTYPSLTWTLGVAAAMIPFGIAMNILGGIAMSGVGALAILAGAGMVLLVAATVAASSHILKMGDYDTYPGLDWSLGVSLSLGAFATGMTILGGIIFASFGLGAGMLAAGAGAVLMVAKTIVASSDILANGYTDEDGNLMKPTYTQGPTKEWAEGVSLALGAFSPVYGMMMKNAIFSLFGGGGVGPDDFATAIETVSKGIVTASVELNQGEGVWKGGPTKEWAEGVSLAIGAFSSVYGMMMANAIFSLFGGGGVGPEEFATAIETVSKGIVTASHELNQGEGVWKGGPTKDWAEGVSLAIGAFSPVYGMMMKNAIFSLFGGGGVGPDDFATAIETVSKGIITAAEFFALPENQGIWGFHPSKEWAEGVGLAIGAFAPVFEILAGQSWLSKSISAEDMKKAILTISQGVVDAAHFFADPEISKVFNTEGNYPSKEWGEGVGAAIGAFSPVFDQMNKGSGWFTSGEDVIRDMSYGIKVISSSLVDSAKAFAGYEYDWTSATWKKGEDFSGIWSAYPTKDWAIGVGDSVEGFLDLFDTLEERGYTTAQFSVLSQVLNYGLSSMSRAARTLFKNKDYFDVVLNPDFIKNIATNLLGFAKLGLALDEMLVSEKIITKETKGFLGSDIGATTETESVRETKDLGIVDMVVGNLVRVAKTLFLNKKYFEETSVYDSFHKDVISPSGIIQRFINLTSRLFSTSPEEFYAGMYRVRKAVSSLVRVAKILYSGQDYFGMSIDPNYMKNVGQNILDFNEIVKQLIESEGGGGFWDKVGNMASGLTGTDPISQIAKRMITLATGYDKLANSLIKLGIAMQMLNISDVRMLGGLTRSIISSDESSDVKGSLMSGSSPMMQTGDNSLFENFLNKKDSEDEILPEETIGSKIDKVIELLTNINNNTLNINQFIEMQSDGEIETPPDVQ